MSSICSRHMAASSSSRTCNTESHTAGNVQLRGCFHA
jgi:hypothetical protein